MELPIILAIVAIIAGGGVSCQHSSVRRASGGNNGHEFCGSVPVRALYTEKSRKAKEKSHRGVFLNRRTHSQAQAHGLGDSD